MSDNLETLETEVPPEEKKPRKRGRPRRVLRAPRLAVPKVSPGDAGDPEFVALDGIGFDQPNPPCPFDCTEEHCVISHMGVCIHPLKGGIKPSMQGDSAIKRRFEKARRLQMQHRAEKS